MSRNFLEYEIDNSTGPGRIKTIRGAELPEGILFTPVDAATDGRSLSREAVEMFEAILGWADRPQADAAEDE